MKPQRHRLLLSRVPNFEIVGALWELLFEKCQFSKTLLVGQLVVHLRGCLEEDPLLSDDQVEA